MANGSISAYNIQIVLIVFNRKTHVPNAYIQQLHACKEAKADWVKREKNGWRGFSNLITFLFIHLISVRRNSISISVYHNDFANEIMMTIIHEPHHFYVIRIRIFHMNLLMIKPKIVWWSRFECFAEPLVISTISRSFGITK